MTEPERDSDEKPPEENGASQEHVEPAPFWRRPILAVVAALIALIGIVWRCA